jgi:serine/threonine-protein kinase
MSLQIGQIIDDKYRIAGIIGEGGMGAVYEGENLRIRRRVAIKVLHAETAANADVVRRFEREAQAAGTIGNDHILEVLDLGTLQGGERYMVMEFLDGEPLSGRLKRRGRLTPNELYPIVKQVLLGLAAAHGAGIIHRDLKPDNIFILREKAGQRDYVKIIDFGISKFSQTGGDHAMTRTGTVMGTPYYMSPEQASGSSEADSRSDLYAVGVVLYESVTGHVPFEGNTFNELLFKIVLSDVQPVQRLAPDIDPAFASIITKAMARPVDQRFQTAAQFVAALDNWAQSGASVSVHLDPRTSSPFLPPGVASSARGMVPGSSGVALPPRATPISSPAVQPGDPVMGGGSPRRTQGSWANSQSQMVTPKKGISPAAAATIGGVGLVLMVGVAIGAYKLVGDNRTPPIPTSSVDISHPSAATAAPPVEPPTATAPPPATVIPVTNTPPEKNTPVAPPATTASVAPAGKGTTHVAKVPPPPPPAKGGKPPPSGKGKGGDQADLGY